MEKKARERLEREFLSMPLHHIDTSIILEKPSTPNGRACAAYLNLINQKYRGKFSIPMLGEYMLHAIRIVDYSKRVDLFEIIHSMIQNKRIEVCGIQDSDRIATWIKEKDDRLTTTDRLILASAIGDSAQTFVTLDEKLIHNEVLEDAFRISISHPRDLI
ncbi:MAG: hypothetical protein AABW61_03245 [Candidatus Aenigmatarchaeota archaeon]